MSSIAYSGKVYIQKKDRFGNLSKPIQINNNGTNLFFARLASIVAGNVSVELPMMPKFIDVGSKVGGKFVSHLLNRIPLSDGGVVSENRNELNEVSGYKVTFGAIVPLSNINPNKLNDLITDYRLCSGGSDGIDDYLATVSLEDGVKVTQNYNLVITWVMTFENK